LERKTNNFVRKRRFVSATGVILQDLEGEGIAEIKSLLLQLDKALETSNLPRVELKIWVILNIVNS
jgi:hypothetical protein